MRCKICGAENSDDAKYCEKCGSSLEDIVINNNTDSHIQYYRKNKDGYATASMILGIVSIAFGTVLCCLNYMGIISIISGVLSIIFAIIGWNTDQRGRAIAGLVCGIIGLLFGIMMISFTQYIESDEFQEFLKENYPDIWNRYYQNR